MLLIYLLFTKALQKAFFLGLVAIVVGKYPFPFRTRPSRQPTLMILRLKPRESKSPPGLGRKNFEGLFYVHCHTTVTIACYDSFSLTVYLR